MRLDAGADRQVVMAEHEQELARGTMTFPTFEDEAREVLRWPNDTRHERSDLMWAVLWPEHMARALVAIRETEDGPRPRDAWIDLLRVTMNTCGAKV